MHRGVSVLTDPDRRIWFVSRPCTGVPRNLNVIIVACAEYGISWDVPPRPAAAGRGAVDRQFAVAGAVVGVNFNHETAIRFVPNFLEALAGYYSGEMKPYLPRNDVLVVGCGARRDADKIILPDGTPIWVAV